MGVSVRGTMLLDEIPADVASLILAHLSAADRIRAGASCSSFQRALELPGTWAETRVGAEHTEECVRAVSKRAHLVHHLVLERVLENETGAADGLAVLLGKDARVDVGSATIRSWALDGWWLWRKGVSFDQLNVVVESGLIPPIDWGELGARCRSVILVFVIYDCIEEDNEDFFVDTIEEASLGVRGGLPNETKLYAEIEVRSGGVFEHRPAFRV